MDYLQDLWEILQAIWGAELFTLGGNAIALSTLVVGVFIVIVAIIASHILQRLLKARVFPRFKLDAGLEFALNRFLHYVVLAFGIYIALTSIGLNLAALAGFFALLGVGIGFGLQNLASNFISGIILLFERPVKIGDRITVDDVWGDVEKINLRTTIVNTVDNVSIIIPNSKILEDNLINWSYGDRRIRIHVPVGVAYGSDVEKVAALLLQAAQENDKVLKTPAPDVWFTEFGDSSLNFELICWLPDSKPKPKMMDQLNRAIDRLFRENEIEIPFPQRDLHIRTDATKGNGNSTSE